MLKRLAAFASAASAAATLATFGAALPAGQATLAPAHEVSAAATPSTSA